MSHLYIRTIAFLDKLIPPKLLPFWNHAAGPKTVFFWCPVVKWGLVGAGIGDLSRSPDQISLQQTASLGATGIIWARYSVVIIPKNYGLLSANLFLAITNFYQVYRAYSYQRQQEKLKGLSDVAVVKL